MSRVYFKDPTDTAELHGSERAWLAGLINNLAVGTLNLGSHWTPEHLRKLMHPGHYLNKSGQDVDWQAQWAQSYATAFHVGIDRGTPLVQYQNREIDTFTLALNTALVLGSDALKLGARLHGQCELNCWIDGPNRSWAADIIDQGLDAGVYREGPDEDPQGWRDVATLLRARDDESVVISDSTGSGFPDPHVGGWMPAWPEGIPETWAGWDMMTDAQKAERDERQDAFHDLDFAEQWRISMAALRAKKGHGLEIRPDNWQRFRFGHRLSVLDIMASDWEQRLSTALGLTAAAA